AVVRLRPEVLADALDQVRPAGAAGVDRALRVGAHHPHPPGASLLEVPAGAADGAAGADAGHEVGDPAVGLPPQLWPGRLVVRQWVVDVGVLVGLPGAGNLPRQPVGDVVVRLRVLGRHGGRADHHLGAVRPEHADLVDGHLVRAHEHAAVTLPLGHDGQPDAGVAAGRLDDRATGAQLAGLLGGLDHPQRDAVLDRAAGCE